MSPSTRVQSSATQPRALLVIVHGLAEYAERYRAHANAFAQRGISTLAFDQRGHGPGAAIQTHVDRFSEFVEDAHRVCRELRAQHPGLPLFVWGHSMGAIVSLLMVSSGEANLRGIIVSSNSLEVFKRGPNPLNPMFRLASLIAPQFRVPLGLDPSKISSDEAVQRSYANDPLIPKTASLRLIVEFARACERVRELAPRIATPTLIVHGESDRIAPARGSQILFDSLGAADKTLKIYSGLRHEVHNEREPDRTAFIELLAQWVLERAG